jgi:hypothetical protein
LIGVVRCRERCQSVAGGRMAEAVTSLIYDIARLYAEQTR